MLNSRNSLFVFCAIAACASTSQAVGLGPGVYRLHNHPDGNVLPPPYGARFDELYNATGGHDVFTLDFDDPSSAVFLTYTATTISITGSAKGGRDIGGGYAADAYNGMYTLSFTYSLGVTGVPGDDDVWVDTTNHANTGTISTPLGHVIDLVDERGSFDYSLRLGDEDNDLGHRGFAGLSGWGWLSYATPGGIHHVESTDWLFTIEIPTPASAALLGLAGVIASRRRRS